VRGRRVVRERRKGRSIVCEGGERESVCVWLCGYGARMESRWFCVLERTHLFKVILYSLSVM
jgi:hypothetical protein